MAGIVAAETGNGGRHRWRRVCRRFGDAGHGPRRGWHRPRQRHHRRPRVGHRPRRGRRAAGVLGHRLLRRPPGGDRLRVGPRRGRRGGHGQRRLDHAHLPGRGSRRHRRVLDRCVGCALGLLELRRVGLPGRTGRGTSSRPPPAAATRRCPGRRPRPRTSQAPRRSSPRSIRRRPTA